MLVHLDDYVEAVLPGAHWQDAPSGIAIGFFGGVDCVDVGVQFASAVWAMAGEELSRHLAVDMWQSWDSVTGWKDPDDIQVE